MRSVLRIAPYAVVGCGFAAAWLANVDPALAQSCYPFGCGGQPRGAPAPLIGVGLPIAGAAFAALVIIRHFRGKE